MQQQETSFAEKIDAEQVLFLHLNRLSQVSILPEVLENPELLETPIAMLDKLIAPLKDERYNEAYENIKTNGTSPNTAIISEAMLLLQRCGIAFVRDFETEII